ncbi:hypothetical protein I8748_26535 [Nostoc sp. CENA67]|uniref:Uncharacterized protein n=1 Tax=Amazonocrinis nigriterrae CENA67 TaxID=2794033 RepID=A0A8J7LAP8_9NOST|nr:hypothetical protein [Amazonocrinis nigriterrae]MBH8565688.1 hypothetical protein [Amazonocrinis nigriterrae CENA67]
MYYICSIETKAFSRGKTKTSQNLDNSIDGTFWGVAIAISIGKGNFWGRDWCSTAPKPTNGRLQDSGSTPDGSTCLSCD